MFRVRTLFRCKSIIVATTSVVPALAYHEVPRLLRSLVEPPPGFQYFRVVYLNLYEDKIRIIKFQALM